VIQRILINAILSLPLIGAYAINAVGIVVVYRASKVLNLAHGAITMLAAYTAFQLVKMGLPGPLGLVGGVVGSAILALLVERLFVRRLRAGGPTAQTIGTVAAFGVIVAFASRVWGTTPRTSVTVFPHGTYEVFGTVITNDQIGLFVSMLVITFALYTLLQRTYLGLVLRGTAENRLAASMMGADPDRMTQLAWAIGGVMAGLAGEMLAAVGSLHPYNLALAALPAYVAALLGGMNSLPAAVVGAGAVGLVEGLIPLIGPLESIEGNGQLVIAIVALIVMARRGARVTGAEAAGPALDATTRASGIGRRPRGLIVAGLAVALLFPHLPFVSYALLGNANEAAVFAMVAVALVLLTGWIGQISLGHAAFVGIGAYITGIFSVRVGLPFPLTLLVAVAFASVVAAGLGLVALRVRGLYLAAATMIFAWMGEKFLFSQAWFTRDSAIFPTPVGRSSGGILKLSVDLTDRRVMFYISWALVALVVFIAANLRDTKTGRAFFAVKGSEMAAASLGVDVTRYKLIAFVLSGLIGGAAGNILMMQQRAVVSDQFAVVRSLFFLAVLVVGGVQSLGGAVAAALVFGGIKFLFFQFPALSEYVEVVSALLLAGVLLLYRRGLAGLPDSLAPLVRRLEPLAAKARPLISRLGGVALSVGHRLSPVWAKLRLVASRAFQVVYRIAASIASWIGGRSHRLLERALPGSAKRAVQPRRDSAVPVAQQERASFDRTLLPQDRTKRVPLLEAEDVTVRFGGLTAANHVFVTVYEGEIVGLIGPNGAGKTTTFNAIAGLNDPTEGTVRLFGQDVTGMPVHERAAMGVGRTFQLIQLFPQLSVFDNLLVATHLHNPSGVFSGAIAGRRCLQAEASERRRVRDVIHLLGLDDIAERIVAGLPFGVLRMLEVGRALVTDPRLIMLDEPASGLDNKETDRLSELLFSVRDLGVALLLIEHDVRMVTGVSDYMYVIDQGTPLAQGTPSEIQRNRDVIAAYLGEAHAEDTKPTPKSKRRREVEAKAEAER
jgi:ABC-type branched-subunit amino acid transport system ATPase component/branched-subunit amino acid ABC-type transport system permease component